MKNMNSVLTAVVTLTFIVSPAFTDPFSGFRADQLPVPQINPPIQPAGYAFAIWGLIYGWLLVSAVYGIAKRASDPAWNQARPALIISLAVGTPWLAVANISAIWATIAIFVMAASAIWALLRAPQTDRWWFRVPIACYAGWLTAASFVSLGSTAAGYGLLTDGLGWAYIGIAGALLVAGIVIWHSKTTAYGLTIVWALVGIIVANWGGQWGVTLLASAGVAVVLLLSSQNRTSPDLGITA